MDSLNLTINSASGKKWKCRNGHEYQSEIGDEPWGLAFSIHHPPQSKFVNCCPMCLADALEKIAVPLKEVDETLAVNP